MIYELPIYESRPDGGMTPQSYWKNFVKHHNFTRGCGQDEGVDDILSTYGAWSYKEPKYYTVLRFKNEAGKLLFLLKYS